MAAATVLTNAPLVTTNGREIESTMKTRTRTIRQIAAIGGVLILTAAACSGDDTTEQTAPTTAVERTTTEAPQTTTTTAATTTTASTAAPTTTPPATTTSTTAPATTTTTTESLPEAGDPNSVTMVFEDGETITTSVSCDSDPFEDFFEFSFRSFAGDIPSFELLFFADGLGEVADWSTEDEIWIVSPTEGSIDLVSNLSQSPILGTAVFLKADLSEGDGLQFTTPSGGQPLTTGEERAATFTIVCADFNGDDRTLTTGG